MSQNTTQLPTVGTVSGLQMTQNTNNALDTLLTLCSGAAAPSATGMPEAGQLWHDTTNNLLKIRSLDNTSWIPFLQLSETAYAAAPSNTSTGTNDRLNRAVNGAMNIDQANEGASYSISTANAQQYTLDQWIVSCLSAGASGVTAQQVSDAPAGFPNSLKITVGTGSAVGAGEWLLITQNIEGYNLSDLNFGTASAVPLSLSFWVKSSQTGTFAFSLMNSSEGRVYVGRFTIAGAGTWTQIAVPNIAGDQSGTWLGGSSIGLRLFITVATGSTYQTSSVNSWIAGPSFGSNTQTNTVLSTNGATFQLTGVQLNSGVFCQPYEKRTVQQELEACQRYFEKSYDIGTVPGTPDASSGALVFYGTAAGTGFLNGQFKVNKRTDPSITFYSYHTGATGKIYDLTGAADVSVTTSFSPGHTGFSCNFAIVASHAYGMHWSVSARM